MFPIDRALHVFKWLPYISVFTRLVLAPHQQGDWGRHSYVCRRQIRARLQSSCSKLSANILSNCNNSLQQMHILPHQLTLGLCSGQLLLVDGNLLPQRQTLHCDSIHFLQGAEGGERKTRSAEAHNTAVWKVFFFTLTGRPAHPPVSLNSKATLQCRGRGEEEEQEEDQTQQKLCLPIHFPAGVSQLIHSF